MRSTYIIPLLLLLFVAQPLFGQASSRDRAVSAFDRGVQQLLDGSPRRAARSFGAAVDHDDGFLPARRLLGVALDLEGDPAGALAAYHEVLRRDSTYSRLLYYQVGDVYLRKGEPRTALEWFGRFRELQQRDRGDFGLPGEQEAGTEAFVLEHELRQRILSAQITSDSLNYVHASELERLGPEINGPLNEYFPFFTNDGTGVLFTRQSADGDEDLITGRRRRAGATFTTTRFGTFNTQQPEGMCTLVRDGETIFFTLCHEVASGGSCDLHAGVLIDGRIEGIVKLPDHLNSATWDSQAAISCDGRQLLFASTRPGGVGGSDLYACRRLPDGGWSEPVNLGAGVNSPGDEEAPFLSNDGETLYFSSTGHAGLGDQDIYFSRLDPASGRWAPAVNIGPPINGPSRELGFHLTPDGRTGYFASDRAGGAGGLDIYRFRLGETLTGREVTYVSGYVTDSLTGAPLPDQPVPVAAGDVFRTNYAGRFFICAPPGQGLPLTVDRAGYAPYRRTFDVPAWDNRSPYRIDLRLSRPTRPAASPSPPPPPSVDTVVREEEVMLEMLFGFEQATPLRGELDDLEHFLGGLDLDRIVTVTVAGFTDETGGDAFNQHLSQRRADAVAELLRTAGVPADRITAEGRGEIKEAADRRQNRKVSIRVRLR